EVVGWRTLASNSTYYSRVFSPVRGLIPDVQTVVEDGTNFSRVSSARAINDRGQIIATGNNGHFPLDPSRRGLVLTPLFGAPGDLDGDGSVGLSDLTLLLSSFGLCAGDPGFVVAADMDSNGCVELTDMAMLLSNFGG